MNILITGGAGFVGSQMAALFRQSYPTARIVAFDNLKRRGSELNLARLKSMNVEFVHGDIRQPADFDSLTGSFDLFIEASAEPSVLAGLHGSPLYAIDTNLGGTVHCLEFARKRCGSMVFLSTSRVYSIPALTTLPLKKNSSRFQLEGPACTGVTEKGITEDFTTTGFRSIYGTTKLASEMLIEEYVQAYGMKAVINRCGVICGPWQMGKVDQGVFMLWMARHTYGGPLSYTGFDGNGFQVRDLIHPRDLYALIQKQLNPGSHWSAEIFNVGGGIDRSISLAELTDLCQEITGRRLKIDSNPQTNAVDIPFYASDFTKAQKHFQWTPQTTVKELMVEIHQWLLAHESQLKPLFQ